jgi:hypothetical protein
MRLIVASVKQNIFHFGGLTRFCKAELICPSRQFVAPDPHGEEARERRLEP